MNLNALKPESSNVLGELYRAAVPLNARTLIDTAVRGKTSDITENDLSVSELNALRDVYETTAASNATNRQTLANKLSVSPKDYEKAPEVKSEFVPVPNSSTGYTVERRPLSYDEYITKTTAALDTYDRTKNKTSVRYNDYPDKLAAPTFDSWLNTVWKSYTDPAYRLKTTLGSFNVQETPTGLVATDKYDFDAADFYARKGKPPAEMSTAEMWKRSNGPVDFLDMLMIKRGAPSRNVNIKLPPK
jgi:hypothetical protein